MTAILEAAGLRKVYQGGDGLPIEVLAGVANPSASVAIDW